MTIQTTQPVVMLWDFHTGYRYVGPFATVAEANDWGCDYEDRAGSPCWHSELVDPDVPLEIRAPDDVAVEPSQDPCLERWAAPPSNTPSAAFFLLMTDSEPLHLVGPFADPRAAFAYGKFNEEVRKRDFGWQIVWLEHPNAVARLLSTDAA
jgi:hypothetical protein